MSDAPLLATAALLGFAVAAPVGPIGLVCLSRTLERGAASGFASGLGAASADALFALAAGLGLAAASAPLAAVARPLRVVAALLLLAMGLRALLRRPAAARPARAAGGTLARDYASVLALTLANPATVLHFAIGFAGLGLMGAGGGWGFAAPLAAGVFLGSAAWWLALALGGALLRERLDARWRGRVTRAAAGLVALLAALALGAELRA
ncbi:MAG TPA: LysE family transporter [Candidatus Thermoplasmatota archaeon]|nr:LysE family transporter [Candidatus Thermoplasmatota archaeon]